MNGRVLLLAAALVLLLAMGVAAQGDTGTRRQGDIETAASTTYSLDWWTVDGGGASYNSTGSYILGGTAGQPDAAVPRSGGSDPVYTLRAGFWQPSCVAAAVVTTITRALSNPNTVTLSWTHNEANQTYQVHRATTPYFTPVAGTLQESVTAGPWSDDEIVIGDPNINYFYLVRATCGAAYADPGGWGGEFDFRLVPGN